MNKDLISTSAILLIVVGVGGYLLSNQASLTALIPTAIGVLILGAHALHNRKPSSRLGTGLVAALGALGAAGSFRGVANLLSSLSNGGELSLAPVSQAITFLLCLAILVSAIKRWRAS